MATQLAQQTQPMAFCSPAAAKISVAELTARESAWYQCSRVGASRYQSINACRFSPPVCQQVSILACYKTADTRGRGRARSGRSCRRGCRGVGGQRGPETRVLNRQRGYLHWHHGVRHTRWHVWFRAAIDVNTVGRLASSHQGHNIEKRPHRVRTTACFREVDPRQCDGGDHEV